MAKVEKHHSRAKNKRKKLSNREKIDIIQWREMGLTYNQIANRAKRSYQAVESVVTKWAPDNPDKVKLARMRALEQMASVMGSKANEVMESLVPEMLQHDRVERRDENGQVIAITHSGLTANQLANTVDKFTQLQLGMLDRAGALEKELSGADNEDVSAEGLAALTANILSMAKNLNISIDLGSGEVVGDDADYEDVTDGGGSDEN